MQTKNVKIKAAVLCLCLGIVSLCPAKVIYVDADATGANNGTSCADAYNYLQDALADANACAKPVEILVAKGTYRPDEDTLHPGGTGDRQAAFQLIGDVNLRGGYAGIGEPDPNARDIGLFETILSGDLNGDDEEVADPCDLLTEPTRAENSYHVVTGIDAFCYHGEVTAEFDGFTVSGGNANGPFTGLESHGAGGGMGIMYMCYMSPKVVNCTFRDNSADCGGAIAGLSGPIVNCLITRNAAWNGGGLGYCRGLVRECRMEDNYAESSGGAFYLWEGSPEIERCTFSDNRAESGAGVFIADAEPNLIDCTFSGNAAVSGGGMHSAHFDNPSNPTLIGCAFIENTADSGGGMYNAHSGAMLTNCTFTGNHADSRGGAMYNTNSDPVVETCTFAGNFASEGGGLYLTGESLPNMTNCIFTGNSVVSGGAIYNYEGYPRIVNCTFSGNRASDECGGVLDFDGISSFENCILWANTDKDGADESAQIGWANPMHIRFNCVQGWTGSFGGTGNVDADPCFVDPGYWDTNGTPDANDDSWVDGDYHLKSQAGRWHPDSQTWTQDDVTSSCIDAGDPMDPIGPEPFPNGGIINMGAFGGTAEASKSYFGRPLCEVIAAGDVNGDCIIDFKDFVIMALHWCEDHNP